MCDEPSILTANTNTPKLKGIIDGLNASLSLLRTAHAENTGKLAKMGNEPSEILVKINAEIIASKPPNPILQVTAIQGIHKKYAEMTRVFDTFTAALANSISSSRSELAQYTKDAAIAREEIEACIEKRKMAADAMVDDATRLVAEITQKEADCNARIVALEKIANTETENQGLKSRIAALKLAHSRFKSQLQAIKGSHVPNTNVSKYQSSLAGASVGADQLKELSEQANKYIETLNEQNGKLKAMLDELKAGEGNTAAIKEDIEKDKAEAAASKAAEERVAAAASDKAAKDIAVVKELSDTESVSIYLPTTVSKRPRAPPQAVKQPDSSSQSEPFELDEVEPETILEFVVNRPAAAGKGGSIRHRGKRHVLQRGGVGEGAPIVFRITELTPDVRTLLLNFEPLNQVLTPQLFRDIIKDVTPMSIEDAATEYTKIKGALISSKNKETYFDILGQKVAWKTSIMKLMNFLDSTNPRPKVKNNAGEDIPVKSYSEMYNDLWTFMDYNHGSIAKLREIFSVKKRSNITKTLESELIDTGDISDIRVRVGWVAPTINTLFDNLFKVFSDCNNKVKGEQPKTSMFLTERTSMKANNMYRFKLNWLILIAFHIYHTANPENPENPENQRKLLIDICEFVKHLYYIFVGWMVTYEPDSLYGEFTNTPGGGDTYKVKTKKLITAESTDGSLTRLRQEIRKKLCDFGPNKELISAARAAKASAKAAEKLQASSPASSPASSQASSQTSSPASSRSSSPFKAWGEETQGQPSPRERRVREMTEAEQNAVAEEARKRFARQDAAAGLSRGGVVTDGPWKNSFIKPPSQPKKDSQFIRTSNSAIQAAREGEHAKHEEKIARAAAAYQQSKKDETNAKLGPEKGPSYSSIREGREAAHARANAKSNIPTPPLTGSPSPRKTSRPLKPLDGSRGGNKQRTRKRQRIASTHHHTKRRILRNKNHKHTRKARLTRASVSV